MPITLAAARGITKMLNESDWGQWHEGNSFDARVYRGDAGYLGPIYYLLTDTYPNNFRCLVEVRDRKSGKIVQRKGLGKYIGNFSPIWINFRGERLQLTELLRK